MYDDVGRHTSLAVEPSETGGDWVVRRVTGWDGGYGSSPDPLEITNSRSKAAQLAKEIAADLRLPAVIFYQDSLCEGATAESGSPVYHPGESAYNHEYWSDAEVRSEQATDTVLQHPDDLDHALWFNISSDLD